MNSNSQFNVYIHDYTVHIISLVCIHIHKYMHAIIGGFFTRLKLCIMHGKSPSTNRIEYGPP